MSKALNELLNRNAEKKFAEASSRRAIEEREFEFRLNEIIRTAPDFEVVLKFFTDKGYWIHKESQIFYYERFMKENEIYNSPLAKALREEE